MQRLTGAYLMKPLYIRKVVSRKASGQAVPPECIPIGEVFKVIKSRPKLLPPAGRPLCCTFGCTLPDRHTGLHRIPNDDVKGGRKRGQSSTYGERECKTPRFSPITVMGPVAEVVVVEEEEQEEEQEEEEEEEVVVELEEDVEVEAVKEMEEVVVMEEEEGVVVAEEEVVVVMEEMADGGLSELLAELLGEEAAEENEDAEPLNEDAELISRPINAVGTPLASPLQSLQQPFSVQEEQPGLFDTQVALAL